MFRKSEGEEKNWQQNSCQQVTPEKEGKRNGPRLQMNMCVSGNSDGGGGQKVGGGMANC